MRAAAQAMSGSPDPVDATAAPGVREGAGQAGPVEDFVGAEAASSVSGSGPTEAVSESAGSGQTGPSAADPLSIGAESARADVAEAPLGKSPISPAADLDERLIKTAESNGAARTLDRAGPRSSEPPAAIADPEPAAVPGGEDAPDRARARGYGLGALLAATALSGLLGAGLMLLAAPLVRGPTDRVRARIEQVEQQMGALAPADLGAIERRLAAIEPEQRSLGERLARVQAQAEAAALRAEQSDDRARATAAGPPATGEQAATAAGPRPPSDESITAAVEPLAARVAALEGDLRALARSGAEAIDAKLAEQAERVAQLEGRVTQGLEPLGGLDQQIAQLTQQLTQQGQALAQVTQRLAQLDQTLAGQTQKVSQLDPTLAGQAQQIVAQGQRLAGLEKQFADRGPEAMTAGLRVVAADRVIDALREGAPFPQAFAALRRLTPEAPALRALEPFANSGAPTAPALSEEFKPLGQRIVAEARGRANDVTDRLWRMAEGVVAVRPLSDAGSTSTSGLVARIENALERSALQDATAAWDALPEPSRQASDPWGRKLKARVAADGAARTIAAEALGSLDAAAR